MAQKFFNKIDSLSVGKLIVILFVIAFIVYIPILFNGFVWDDASQITQNPIVQNSGDIVGIFAGGTFFEGKGTGLVGNYYKPFMSLTFLIINAIFGLNPFFFHLFDIILHGVNGILLFLFLKKVFVSLNVHYRQALAFFLTFVFLIHPANIESVAYISSSQELLYTCFLLISLLVCFSLKDQFSKVKLFCLSLSLLASLLSKESGILASLLVIVLMFDLHTSHKKWIFFGIFLADLSYIILRFAIARIDFANLNPLVLIQIVPLSIRLQTIPYEIFSYLRLLIFPKDLFIGQDDLIRSIYFPRFYFLLPITLAIGTALVTLFVKVRSALFRFFLLWIIFGFGMLLNIVPLDMTIAERWMYGPMIGVLGAIGVGISIFSVKQEIFLKALIIVILVISPFYILRDYTREFLWHDNAMLFFSDEKYEKNSGGMYNLIGLTYASQGNLKKAEEYLKQSIEVNPYQFEPYANLGIVYDKEGNLPKARLSLFLSIEHGAFVQVYINYVAILLKHKLYGDALNFLLHKALVAFPQSPILYQQLSEVYKGLGDTVEAQYATQKAALLAQ